MMSFWNIVVTGCCLVVVYLDILECYTLRQVRDVPNELVSCTEPLGVIRDSINVQNGFTITEQQTNDVPDILSHQLADILLRNNEAIQHPATHSTEEPEANSYIQAEFSRLVLISGMHSQGSPNSLSRVTYFQITYSTDCVEFTPLLNKETQVEVFPGNLFANTTVTVMFDQVFSARCVRVVPTQKVGSDTEMRMQFLGCEPAVCRTPLSIKQTLEQGFWKKFVFDKEKIISSLTISLVSMVTEGVPAFILAYSRTCNFDSNAHIIKYNGTIKIYTVEENELRVVISDEAFPIRAQCFAIFSPDPDMMTSQEVNNQPHGLHMLRLDKDQYNVEFEGCDALESHDALDSCGKTHVTRHKLRRKKRVTGGDPSIPGEWPWLVSLHFLRTHSYTNSSGLKHLCGASLIHPQWVLTAAHCVDEVAGAGLSDKSNWLAVFGEHYQGGHDGTEQIIEIEKIVQHPDFVLALDHRILYDIALMKLVRPVHLSDYVNTVCLEPNYTFPDHTPCVTAGWGYTEVDGVGVELPHHALLQTLPTTVCEEKYDILDDDHPARVIVSIEESVICAIAEESGTDSCQGDSGGPLVCYHDDHWTQIGVVSFGLECGDLRYPGVYTRVNHYYDWMVQVINADDSETVL